MSIIGIALHYNACLPRFLAITNSADILIDC